MPYLDSENEFPLHWACFRGNKTEVERLLAEKKVLLNNPDFKGDTALHVACDNGNLECVQFLIENGADINAEDTDKWTALHLACGNGHLKCAELLLQNGVNINAEDIDKRTALHVACGNGHLECVQFLIENGADINAEDTDKWTALHYACYNGYVEAVKMLLKNGADVNSTDNTKSTALHYASMHGHADIVKELLEYGANIDLKNNSNSTARELAIKYGHEDKVLTLKGDLPDPLQTESNKNQLDATSTNLTIQDTNEDQLSSNSSNLPIQDTDEGQPISNLSNLPIQNTDSNKNQLDVTLTNLTIQDTNEDQPSFDSPNLPIQDTNEDQPSFDSPNLPIQDTNEDQPSFDSPNLPIQDTNEDQPAFNSPKLPRKAQFYSINIRGYVFRIPLRYKNVEHCEKGGQGRVATAIDDLTGKNVVIKCVPIEKESSEKNVYREFMLLKTIKHPNIISLLNAFTSDKSAEVLNTVYFVMPYVTSTLSSCLGPFNEKLKDAEILKIVYKILCGLKYMHTFGIVHRDLKPNNIGITESGDPIIFDLGLSRAETINRITSRAGTISYMPPEILLAMESNKQTVKADIWSLACIWIEMIIRKPFINDHENNQLSCLYRILEKLGTPNDNVINKSSEPLRTYFKILAKYEAKPWSELIPANKFHVFIRDDEAHVKAVQETISTMLKFDPVERISAHDLVDKFERMGWAVRQEFNAKEIEVEQFKEACREAARNPKLWKELLFNSIEEYKNENNIFGFK